MYGFIRRARPVLAALLIATFVVAGAPSGVGATVASPASLGNQPRVMDGRVYAIVSSGDSVYVGGSFTSIRPASSTAAWINQARLFKFDVATGEIDQAFRPVIDGDVEGLALSADGSRLYVGGAFTHVNGATRTRLAKLATADGSIDTGFAAAASDRVKDLALRGNDLIVGGYFRFLNGTTRERLGAVDAATGALRAGWNVPLTGPRDTNGAFLQELDVSPDGSWMVVGGNFKTVGGQAREQVAVIGLGEGTAWVANWRTERFVAKCATAYSSTYIRGLDISPDSTYFVVNTTGYHFNGTLCDSASRWELPPTTVGADLQPTWVTWTGTDTHWAAEVTADAVYVGGHQRWENAPEIWNNRAPGRVERPGIAALDPTNGVPLSWNPGRDRGRGAEALLATAANLFVGSDTTLFGGVNRQRLAVVPFAGGFENPAPQPVALPVTWHVGLPDGSLAALAYDGAAFGASDVVSGPAVDGEDWNTVRDGFVQHGQLVTFGADETYSRRPFDGVTFGPATNLSATVGYVATNAITPFGQPFNVAETTHAAYVDGWMYYTRTGDTRLWYRGYANESGIVGGFERLASQSNWSGARALDIVGEWLYAAWSDGNLYRFHLDGRRVQFGSRTLVDDGSVAGVDWAAVGALFGTPSAGVGYPPGSPETPPPPPCTTSAPWAAQYFATDSPVGVPATTRCDAAIDFAWGRGKPQGTAVGPNLFSVRWTRSFKFTRSSTLQFTATGVDDGLRVTVDGISVIDAWTTKAGNRTGQTGMLPKGRHKVVVEYFDRSGIARVDVDVTRVPSPATADATAPETTLTTPAAGASVSEGTTRLAGTANDNVGVTGVRVAVRDTAAGLWLQADGTWAEGYVTRLATLVDPGRATTNWSIGVPLGPGAYFAEVRARDAAGNVDQSASTVSFTVT